MSLIRQLLRESDLTGVAMAARTAGYTIGPVWHGTEGDFTTFSHACTRGQLGFHVGSESQARWFADPIPLFVSAKSPLRLPDTGSWHGDHFKSILSKALGQRVVSDNDRYMRDLIKSAGYDSIVYLNTKEWADDDGDASDSMILFEPWQLKSASRATYNDSGHEIHLSQRFDPSNPDIRY